MRTALLLFTALAAACTHDGDALVVVHLESTATFSDIASFDVIAAVGTTSRSFTVTPPVHVTVPPAFDFGIRVPAKLGKTLDLAVTANAADGPVTVHGSVDFKAGKRSDLTLSLDGTLPPDLTVPPGVDLAGADLTGVTPPDLTTPLVDAAPSNEDLTGVPACDEATCGPCHDCGAGGTCSKLVVSADDDKGQTCNGSNTCSTTGVCKIRQGFACTPAAEADCITGNCVDGVCCDTPKAMCGECKICNKTGSEGLCVNAADGTDPDSECGNFNCHAGACKQNCVCPVPPPDGGLQQTPCNNASDGYSGSGVTPDSKINYYCDGNFTCIQKRCTGSCGLFIQCGNNQCSSPALMCSC